MKLFTTISPATSGFQAPTSDKAHSRILMTDNFLDYHQRSKTMN